MGYVVECFNNVMNISNLSSAQEVQQETANKYFTTMQYFTHEIEGYKRITTRSDSIHVAQFENIQFDRLLAYIRDIRNQKSYKIDCIYRDDIPFGILYTSSRYLKRLDKELANSIKKTLCKNKTEILKIKGVIGGRTITSFSFANGDERSVFEKISVD